MNHRLLGLWFTRIDQAPAGASDPGLERDIRRGDNVIVSLPRSSPVPQPRPMDIVLQTLEGIAYDDAPTDGKPVVGWLAVDVPIPNVATAQQMLHRMIRRLYFSSVFHGLSTVPAFRSTVQSLRSSYLQTRGTVTTEDSTKTVGKGGPAVELSSNPLKLVSVKLTAEAEVEVAEKLAAEMERLDVLEAEDQLVQDLQLLTLLEVYLSKYADVIDAKSERWERIKGLFRRLYARYLGPGSNRTFSLRPIFVFEAASAAEAIILLELLSAAAGLARAHGAQLVVAGHQPLAALFEAGKKLGSPIFRTGFTAPVGGSSATLEVGDVTVMQAMLASGKLSLTVAQVVAAALHSSAAGGGAG